LCTNNKILLTKGGVIVMVVFRTGMVMAIDVGQ